MALTMRLYIELESHISKPCISYCCASYLVILLSRNAVSIKRVTRFVPSDRMVPGKSDQG